MSPNAAVRTSERLKALAQVDGREHVTLAEVMSLLGERSFALLVLTLTLPNAVPVPAPPGLSGILSIPVALIALQMALGLDRPILPGFLLRRRVRRTTVAAFAAKAHPPIAWLERLVQPRHHALTNGWALRVVALLCVLLSLALALPIPLGNVPVAWGIVVIALGLLECDGLVTVGGVLIGALALGWNALIVLAGEKVLALLGLL